MKRGESEFIIGYILHLRRLFHCTYVTFFCRIEVVDVADSDDEVESVVINNSVNRSNAKQGVGISRSDIDGDSNVFKMNNNNNPSFPSGNVRKRRFDDYGEIIQ